MATWTIATGTDDGHWDPGGGFSATSNYCLVGYASSQPRHAFFRYTNITIPQGTTILTAKITFVARYAGSGTVGLYIYGNDVDSATAPTTNADAANLGLTTAYTSWSPVDMDQNSSYDTPDLTSVVQEIVDRAGWSSGNAMQFIVRRISGTNPRYLAAVNYSTSILTITYVGEGGATFTQKVVMF